MELVTNSKAPKAVYIPHHFVVKEDSSTTKLRVVFDASMKSSSGVSLNDALMVGPTIQEDLFTLLLRFRTHHVALKADVAKMYRQFEIHEDDRDYQRILWRESEDKPIQEYRLKTVTYGTACAPFLATRCLTQLAEDESLRYPAAARAVKNAMYVDDLIGGESSTQKSLALYHELNKLCEAGGLQIRKWCSSSTTVLDNIPLEVQETDLSQDFDTDSTVKALGIRWNPIGDYFYFDVQDLPQQQLITKREILSQLAKTFDPVGWLSPVTITAKIIFQDLWKETMDWDAPVSDAMKIKWEEYRSQLQLVSNFQIPRCVVPHETIDFQLHGFADSSEKAYAVAVYLRCVLSNGEIITNLLTSRTKVAPMKQTSLPRLELCAAHLLAETIESLGKCFTFKYSIHAWTDSMITLKWITSPSRRWKTFVANRVAAIQDVLPPRCWSHVRSADNPADLPSRGIPAVDLINNQFWLRGPSWLSSNEFPSSQEEVHINDVNKEERKVAAVLHCATNPDFTQVMSKFSSLRKVITSVAWYARFFKFLKKKESCIRGPITPVERHFALQTIIKFVQCSTFPDEVMHLSTSRPIKVNSRLKQLTPFLDKNGLLRVGGRIQKSSLAFTSKHPLILPSNHIFIMLLIRDHHQANLHAGFTSTLGNLRRKYWILKGRDVVRNVIKKCITCRKVKATQQQQLMGNLPEGRVTPSRPFLHCGVDFAGPFFVTMKKGRGVRPEKAWMCVFVCFSTKAVHLDVVTSMSTDAFIACYKRFVSRRGVCSHLYSDCGTNFVGADNLMQRKLKEAQNEVQQQFTLIGTTHVYNASSGCHQGGYWESVVKSAKYHLKRVVGTTILSLEQFQTLLCNVESCLNSRPLCSISTDPLDIDALTPGHFLVGHPLTAVPEPDLTLLNTNRLDHWQLVQQMSQHFWRRWRDEYLTTLQQRRKWTKPHRNLAVGDLVVVREDVCPPNKWKIGRIIATRPGADGLVRNVSIKTANGEIIRPIQKLSILFSNDES